MSSHGATLLPMDRARTSAPAPVAPLARSRFRTLVQSPLRSALLRHCHEHPRRSFDLDGLVQAFGHLPVDIENCLAHLVEHGVVMRLPTTPPRYQASLPADPSTRAAVEEFLAEPLDRHGAALTPTERRFREMIGRDEKMLLLFESIRTVAKTDLSVLVLGPTGSGKEVVARLIHEFSRRRAGRFQAVNCSALPDTLFESELFGFERGAFTGAFERKPGRIELAHNGTLFLDEIGDLAIASQAKLLRVVEERRVERLGGRDALDVDFRLICATHRPLYTFVADERFREDLYYRINAYTVQLPSLRERPVDIPVLAERFLAAYCVAQGLAPDAKRFSEGALERLLSYGWPGNIRELEATVSRAGLAAQGPVVDVGDVHFMHPRGPSASPPAPPDALRSLREVEREHIARVLDATKWNKKRAARVLEIGRETLYRKITDFGLVPSATALDSPRRPTGLPPNDAAEAPVDQP